MGKLEIAMIVGAGLDSPGVMKANLRMQSDIPRLNRNT